MKTKKTLNLLFMSVAIILIVMASGCKKDNEEQPIIPDYAWVVGNMDSTGYALILFTPDGGDTWVRQGEGSAALQGIDLYDVWAVDTSVVWAVGMSNTVLKTTDGGVTWNRMSVPQDRHATELYSVSLAAPGDIWVSGSDGRVYHSKNDGVTWTIFDTSFFHNGLMQGIHAVTSDITYVTGGVPGEASNLKGFIARTLDGGQTWDSIVPENDYNRNEWIGVKSSDADHVVIYGGRSHYVFTTDGGQSWVNDSVPNTGGTGGADINCLTMLDALTWWGAFDYDGIFITTNGGASWTKQTSVGPGAMWLFGIDYYDRDHAVIVAQSSVSLTGKIMKTSNGGDLWELKYLARTWLNKVSFIKK